MFDGSGSSVVCETMSLGARRKCILPIISLTFSILSKPGTSGFIKRLIFDGPKCTGLISFTVTVVLPGGMFTGSVEGLFVIGRETTGVAGNAIHSNVS